MVYLVSYDLKGYRHASVYHRLAETVKNISGVWMHVGESRWLVETQLSTNDVAGRLAPADHYRRPDLRFPNLS